MFVKSLFNNKFISFLLAIITICVIYQLFFRYEYKVLKIKKSEEKQIKIRIEKKYGHLNLEDYLKK